MRDTTMEYIFLEHIEIYHKLSKYWNYIEAGMNLSSSSDWKIKAIHLVSVITE